MCDIGLILEVLELQYRGFPALAGAQPNRRRHYNTVLGGRRTRVVGYFAGVGHATEGLPNMYETIAYVDHDNLAESAFETRNPGVPQWRVISDIIQSKAFDAVAATADVAFVGAPILIVNLILSVVG